MSLASAHGCDDDDDGCDDDDGDCDDDGDDAAAALPAATSYVGGCVGLWL